MKRSWYWILVILAGSLVLGSALQYYFTGEPDRNTPTRNWLAVGQAILGLAVISFGLYKQHLGSRSAAPETEEDIVLKLDDK